ncbi:MAG TPA: methyltransferase domain-containing protein [Methylomirabilota bacterium]|nr:methyltransferase domain-containing protein [Methylomirabilota bacterium]
MREPRPAVVDFYDRHPINETQVLESARRRASHGALAPEELWRWDQDHYGGVQAVEALARRAAIRPGMAVLDVCAGLGGPARVLAHRFGAQVTGVDLTHSRCAAGARLTALVRLGPLVRLLRADAQVLPFRARAFDAALSQEGLLHVPDKAAVLAECARVLKPGARLAFSDWIARPRLEENERRRLFDWMAAVSLQTIDGYRERLARAGFAGVEAEDLSPEWIVILRERLHMYRSLREHTVARFGQARYEEYSRLYAFFVGLVESGKLGGARFSGAACPAPF